jgi:hypothetical protein
MTIQLLLVLLAFICFLAAAINVPARVNLIALGLALWVLTLVLR